MKNMNFIKSEKTTRTRKRSIDEFFEAVDEEHAMHLLNDHQAPVELIAGTMIAIAVCNDSIRLNSMTESIGK